MNRERESRSDRPGDPRIVLIVEDNPAISTVINWSLRYGDYQPVEIANGLEAVRWMEQAALEQRFASLILLDLAMPGMDGYSLMRSLVFERRFELPRSGGNDGRARTLRGPYYDLPMGPTLRS